MQTASTIFYDNHGVIRTPQAGSVVKPRRGVFALVVALKEQAVLLAAESGYENDLELPGGGIEDGEDLELAIRREWQEEVGIPFTVTGPHNEFQHVRGFYAQSYDQFWIYNQTFRLYYYRGKVEPGKKWISPEGGKAGWEPLHSLTDLNINRAHWCAIPTLLADIAPGLS